MTILVVTGEADIVKYSVGWCCPAPLPVLYSWHCNLYVFGKETTNYEDKRVSDGGSITFNSYREFQKKGISLAGGFIIQWIVWF